MLPARIRETLSRKFNNTLVVMQYQDQCLKAFPLEIWEEEYEPAFKKMPTNTKAARNFRRYYLASATDCTIDKQGRILIPQNLKNFARLEKEVILAGNINHFEIWNKDLFSENIEPEPDFLESEEAKTLLGKLGL